MTLPIQCPDCGSGYFTSAGYVFVNVENDREKNINVIREKYLCYICGCNWSLFYNDIKNPGKWLIDKEVEKLASDLKKSLLKHFYGNIPDRI